ncbi:g999 [Coccomyxa elongata]
MSQPKVATAEQGPVAGKLQVTAPVSAKREARTFSGQDLSTQQPRKRLRTSLEISSDPGVSPTASAVANLLQLAEQPIEGTPQHVRLSEPEFDAFVAKLKRACFEGVPRSKYIQLKKDLKKIRQNIARYEAQLKEAREAASKSLAAQKSSEKQLQSYVDYVRKLRAIPGPK